MVRPYRGFCHNGKMIQKSMPITGNSVSIECCSSWLTNLWHIVTKKDTNSALAHKYSHMVATEYMHRSIQCSCISNDSFKVWISSSVRLLWPNYLSSSSSSSSSSLVQYLKSSSISYRVGSWFDVYRIRMPSG